MFVHRARRVAASGALLERIDPAQIFAERARLGVLDLFLKIGDRRLYGVLILLVGFAFGLAIALKTAPIAEMIERAAKLEGLQLFIEAPRPERIGIRA